MKTLFSCIALQSNTVLLLTNQSCVSSVILPNIFLVEILWGLDKRLSSASPYKIVLI